MIVSHKHKFIFVKTHKTATQTFLKFIKPHLGPDDVMAGDPEERDSSTGEIINTNTQINVDKKFETGLCASDYQETYGNHLPWFMIKTIVGDDTGCPGSASPINRVSQWLIRCVGRGMQGRQ